MGQKLQKWYDANPPKQLGFRPTCDCATEGTVPCLVLDPFLGSGSTAIVAAQEGRSYVGIDLADEYCRLARARIQRATAQPRLVI